MKYAFHLLLAVLLGGPLWAALAPAPQQVQASSVATYPTKKAEKRPFWNRLKQKMHHLREAVLRPLREAADDLLRLLIIILIVALIVSIVVWLLPWPLDVIVMVVGLVILLIFLLRYLQ
ncbi:MAG: hypothetical protein KatS3mg026_0606 [Bacteroidia bacterium]|nr:MAG: hypothetical protein KatS3mg026_0606 [Bacteroidia bacterium]